MWSFMIGFFHSCFFQGSYKLLHVLVLDSFCSLNNITLYGYKITADGYCSHEIKTQLLFGRKAMTSLLLLLLLSCSVQPHRWQPTRPHRSWDSPGKNTGVGCCFLLQCMEVKSESEGTQSCPTPSDPMNCSLPGSSVYGIFQARVLEWGAIAFSHDRPRQHIKKQRHHFANKGTFSQR